MLTAFLSSFSLPGKIEGRSVWRVVSKGDLMHYPSDEVCLEYFFSKVLFDT